MKTKNCIENRNLLFPYTIAEEIDNQNCLERNSEVKENHILIAIEKNSDLLADKYPVIKDDPLFKHKQKLEASAIQENSYQHHTNLRQQKLLDEVITL